MSENFSNHFESLIQERHSTRAPFDETRSISKQDLMKILEAGKWAPTAHNMQNYEVIVVDDKKMLDTICNIEYSVPEEFIRENFQQLSFSQEELAKKKVGIMGMVFPPLWQNPDLWNSTNLKEQISKLGHSINKSSALVIFLYDPSRRAPASDGDFLGKMSLGCVMENMWLMAASLGLSFGVVSDISEHEVEEEVKRIVKIPSNLKIAISFRLGYVTSINKNYLRVRRDVTDFTHHNKYGEKLNL